MMTLKNFLALTALSLAFGTVSAQTEEAALPRKVSNVEVLDLEGKPVTLPYWGEKNLMIFYVDPDHHKQNEDFTVELEKNHRAESDNIHGFGVMNLKDAPMVPNSMARSMARKRTATNGATVLADQTRALSTAWNLGDCNNKFVLMFVTRVKLLADVGLVGFPNVGKSTLLSVTSNARPKIANYHFTTLYPNLGVIYVDEGVSFVMADIPGIIEGAAEGAGLGHDFLRHIDRCRLLVHIVDVSGSEDRDPIEDFEKINAELRDYSPELAERPMIVAANKCDLIPEGSDNLERLRAYVTERGYPFYEISAATTQGTKQLMRVIAGRLRELPPVTVYEPEYVKPLAEAGEADALSIEHMDDLWVVSGKWMQQLIADINFADYESRMYFDRQLRKSGLFDRLEEMGIEDGDTVSIYDFEFEYER